MLAQRAPALFYLGAAALAGLLALGPGGDGATGSPLRPYAWLLSLPGYSALRVPTRFAMVGILCLAVAAGVAAARLWALTASARRWRLAVGGAVVAGLLLDGVTSPIPMFRPPPRVFLPASPPPIVIELPIDDSGVNVEAMYRSMFHRRPVVNGYSGHVPPHYRTLSEALARGDSSALLSLARQQPLVVIVHDRLDQDGRIEAMVKAIPGIQPQPLSGAGSVYLLPAQPGAPSPVR
jgi:hypothetical protein